MTILSILGQVQGVASTATAAPVAQELSVWELCVKGGFIMIPLAALIGVHLCVYRAVHRPAQGIATGPAVHEQDTRLYS